MGLENRVAIVTGAARGLGVAYALRLASEGADVAIWDIDLAGAHSTARAIEAKGRKALALSADIASAHDTTEAAKATFDAFGRIDILVNNAGIANVAPLPLEEIKLEDWERIITVDLTGVFLVCKAVVPYLRRAGKGKIINISSNVALHGGAQRYDYVSAKAGVIGLTRALAVDLGQYNINVNAVTPGGVVTPEMRGEPLERFERFMTGRYLRKHIFAKDLEGVIAFLASDDSDMITGQVFNVDGGRVFIG